MTRRPTRAVVVLATATALALSACSAGSSTSGSSSGSGSSGSGSQSLSVGFVAEPASLDFTRTDGAAIPQALLYNVYEGLVKLDGQGDVKPLLARSWTVSPDRRTYTFELQKGVKFSNGKDFTADDVVFSINRVKKDWTISLKAQMDVVQDVQAVSPTQVKVTLAKPSNSWLYAMASRVGAMFSRTGVSDLATQPVGTGPYLLKQWRRGDSITLTRNPSYWGTKPAVGQVTLKYFKDPTAMNNALLTKQIDVVSTVQTPQSLKQFEGKQDLQVIEGTSTGEVVLSFNNSKAPLNDVRVRRAIRYAIDHKALLDTAWAGHGTLIGSMVPPTDPWYEDLTGMYPHDPAKAKALLAQAGKPSLHLRLRIPNLPYAVAAAQVVKSQLAQVGITADIDTLEFPARWLDLVFTKADYDMSIINHVEPRDIGNVFGNPQYYPRYDSKPVQQALAAADAGTPDQQVEQMKTVARTVSEDAASDFLFLFPNLVVADADVKGLPRNAVTESFDLTALSRG